MARKLDEAELENFLFLRAHAEIYQIIIRSDVKIYEDFPESTSRKHHKIYVLGNVSTSFENQQRALSPDARADEHIALCGRISFFMNVLKPRINVDFSDFLISSQDISRAAGSSRLVQ